jgi:hypothetical protein
VPTNGPTPTQWPGPELLLAAAFLVTACGGSRRVEPPAPLAADSLAVPRQDADASGTRPPPELESSDAGVKPTPTAAKPSDAGARDAQRVVVEAVQLAVLQSGCGFGKADEARLSKMAYPTITRCIMERSPFSGPWRNHTFSAEIVIDQRGLAKEVAGPFTPAGETSFEAWPCVRDYLARQRFEMRSCRVEVVYRCELVE